MSEKFSSGTRNSKQTNKQYTIQIELSHFDNVKIANVANKEVDIPRGRHDKISKSIGFLLLL